MSDKSGQHGGWGGTHAQRVLSGGDYVELKVPRRVEVGTFQLFARMLMIMSRYSRVKDAIGSITVEILSVWIMKPWSCSGK